MCLILTCIAAVITTVLYFRYPKISARFSLEHLALMYWGAALMWGVDGVFRLMEGECFLELTVNDTLLGILVVICGLGFVGVQTLLHKRRCS